MGSICSSRQSEHDSISVSSEESDNKNRDTFLANPTQFSEVKNITKQEKKLLNRELTSNGDEGHRTDTPESPSTTRTLSNKTNPSSKETQSKCVQLPDFTNLKNETRNTIEGKISNCLPIESDNCVSICLFGTNEESAKCMNEVETHLREHVIPDCNSKGWEVSITNIQSSPPIYRSSHKLSHIVNHYIKAAQMNSSRSKMYIVFYVDSHALELPTLISKANFKSLLSSDSSSELWSKWYTHDPTLDAYRLQLPHVHFENLISSVKNEFEIARETWNQEFLKLLTTFKSFQEGSDVIKNAHLAKELRILQESKVSNIEVKVFYKEGVNDTVDIQKLASNAEIITLSKSETEETAAKRILSQLEKSIQSQMIDLKVPMKPLEEGFNRKVLEEISEHNYKCKILGTNLASVESVNLDPIKQYLMQESTKPFIICGPRGSGKTHLCCQIANNCHQWNPSFHVAIRFVGLNENSATLQGIMYFLYEQSAMLYGRGSCLMKMTTIGKCIRELWAKSSLERPLVLILDCIDELSATREELDWLINLPPNVKVILAIQDDSSMATLLHKEIDEQQFMNLETSAKTAEKIFKSNISEESNVDAAFETILTNTPLEVMTPQYILILTQILMLTNVPTSSFPKSLDALIKKLFTALTLSFPKEWLNAVLGVLSLTKYGLTSSEIVSISKSFYSFDWLSLRIVIWPLLRVRKENKVCLIGWSNDYVRNIAYQHFLETSQQKVVCQELLWKHVAISDESNAFNPSKWTARESSLAHTRAFQEASTLLGHSKMAEYFFNYEWLSENSRLCTSFKVLNDLTSVLKYSSTKELDLLKETFLLSIPSLMYDESQLYAQIYGRLKFTPYKGSFANLDSLLESISNNSSIEILPQSPCFNDLDDKNNAIHINAIFRIPGNSYHAIALSDINSQVQVWNIIEKKVVRTLNGINQPRNLEMIDSYKCLLLCGRELRIYDLNKGTFLMKLREVMNQKMPFFGLHNSDHVVALSRSRMYVNMMNINEGTCVTTFKVGEDRFLSSLVVSENGKVCVCGDDSQTPSALLVWDLEARKLMYDLRIPHHEFDTKLVAITVEGHYVCSVSKENDDIAPNFIVVYDLQSGTLFKRWKPEVNIISITISTAGTCVIVGLEDSSIMAYDLVTGNARWSAVGHTSPPDIFKLDKLGLVLLSYDSSSKDHSLRVWDIHTGNRLAVFTPDECITACDMTDDGKFVLLSLQGRKSVIVLSLSRDGKPFQEQVSEGESYGDDQYTCKSFELADS